MLIILKYLHRDRGLNINLLIFYFIELKYFDVETILKTKKKYDCFFYFQ